jgi:NhaA family Na+:H+ antiporter
MNRKLTKLFKYFAENEQTSGIVLAGCTITSIIIANSVLGKSYIEFWHSTVHFEFFTHLKFTLEQLISDGLMAIFFLLVGLEIERELYVGELSDFRTASLPIFAAVGGMLVPALIHFFFNAGTETQRGFGIPMATDIAFVLAAYSFVGKGAPGSLKIFLTALAIIDDLGAILIIAFFYSRTISILPLALAFLLVGALILFNRFGIRNLAAYLIPGMLVWYLLNASGIHATIAGVLLAFTIPFAGGEKSPSYRLQRLLVKPVAFVIMPLFALANTGIVLSDQWFSGLKTFNSLGIIAGLFIGKPVGILLFSFLAVGAKISRLPTGVSWRLLAGAGILAGIGFTMAIFITVLAFSGHELLRQSKIAILLASLSSTVVGILYIRMHLHNKR